MAVGVVGGLLFSYLVPPTSPQWEMRYRPLSVFGRAALSLLGLLATPAIIMLGPGRQSRDPLGRAAEVGRAYPTTVRL